MGDLLACDSMLGRLAKWLRFLGMDTLYLHRGPVPPLYNRILLTRRSRSSHGPSLTGWKDVLYLRNDNIHEQLKEVAGYLKLSQDDMKPLTRCGVCNHLLESVDPHTVAGLVPPYVIVTQKRFSVCTGCRRIYWPATHYHRLIRVINGVFSEICQAP
jgi:uncharacterized protein